MNTCSTLNINTESGPRLSSEIGTSISSNPPCTICSDGSSGFHYGTHACDGCVAFFQRMVTNPIIIGSVPQCTGTKKFMCDINPSNRKHCKRCRLQKCFQMGMSRDKTRLGRRTKAISMKLERTIRPCSIISYLDDKEMLKLIKREKEYFNINAIEEEIIEDDIPEGKSIKSNAKLYSEKNCKIYQKKIKTESESLNQDQNNSVSTSRKNSDSKVNTTQNKSKDRKRMSENCPENNQKVRKTETKLINGYDNKGSGIISQCAMSEFISVQTRTVILLKERHLKKETPFLSIDEIMNLMQENFSPDIIKKLKERSRLFRRSFSSLRCKLHQ